MSEHIQYVCTSKHDYPGCQFCDGGLFACTVCKGMEGSTPTHCPGVPMTEQQSDDVYAGKLDYRDDRGGWCEPDGTGRSMGDTRIYYQKLKEERERV